MRNLLWIQGLKTVTLEELEDTNKSRVITLSKALGGRVTMLPKLRTDKGWKVLVPVLTLVANKYIDFA